MNIMEENGIKELYDAQLRAITPISIADRVIEPGEPIAIFDNIQVADIKELVKDTKTARGGFNNRVHVEWNETLGVTIRFSQGVFGQAHMAISSNAMIEQMEETDVMKKEEFEVDEFKTITLKYIPLVGTLFIYDREMNRINEYILEDKKITFSDIENYTQITVYYDFLYEHKVNKLVIGRDLINGYVEFCAKTKLRDDSGIVKTGLIRMKKVKLMSDLSIRLGKDVPPASISFEIFSYPTGVRGQESSMELIFLDSDIDSDI